MLLAGASSSAVHSDCCSAAHGADPAFRSTVDDINQGSPSGVLKGIYKGSYMGLYKVTTVIHNKDHSIPS